MPVRQSKRLVFPQKTCETSSAAETDTNDAADHGDAVVTAAKANAAGHAVLLRLPLRQEILSARDSDSLLQ